MYLLVDLCNLGGKLLVEIANCAIEVTKVLNDPLKDALEAFGGVLQSEYSLEVKGTLEFNFLGSHL